MRKDKLMKNYIYIGKINKTQIDKYKNRIITTETILTKERLENHISKYHKEEYEQIKKYLKDIITNPDIIIEENTKKDTLIYLKHIKEIDKKARIVIKLATDKKEKTYNKNSIITIMRLRERSWKQTIKNKGKIIYPKN